MDDNPKSSTETSLSKHVLPDVVHSQEIPTVEVAASIVREISTNVSNPNNQSIDIITQNAEEISETESISEEIPSNVEYSSESNPVDKSHPSHNLLKAEKVSQKSSLIILDSNSPLVDVHSGEELSRQSTSWPIDSNPVSGFHHISEESPVNLALSSEAENLSQPFKVESPRTDLYIDSLNDESQKSNPPENIDNVDISHKSESTNYDESPDKLSSGSEDIIKLDIRGTGVPKFSLPVEKIIFGPPPKDDSILDLDTNLERIPVFPKLLSPFLVSTGHIVETVDLAETEQNTNPEEKNEKITDEICDKPSFSNDRIDESDLLVEELVVDYEIKEKDEASMPTPTKSMAPEETMSFSTLTTDYKTICEEYHVKLVHMEAAINKRDKLIEELTVSLQQSVEERDILKNDNDYLTNEVQNLQHVVGEHQPSEHDTIKAQLSDFVKYQSMIKDDSTKFFSALMSGGSSVQSSNSNGEKDMDREEITVNYSRSDLKSSLSDEFQAGFEEKLSSIINQFHDHTEENTRNKLKESIIEVLCEEIGKIRIESDTEIKELESHMIQDKQAYIVETRQLRELLSSVKAGNADVDVLREELNIRHEKEMENLRTYFEKKCSDMERSYSEEVWRGKACASPAGSACSACSVDAPLEAGDAARRRTRSADLPALTTCQPTQLEQCLKQLSKKQEQQLDEMREEHLLYVNTLNARHREAVTSLEEQITQLKAHLQTAENTETNVSLYQQDIDLELEKKDPRIEKRLDQVRQEVIQQLQDQIQVLLSDPDAELSSWPLELVALRDKIHGDAARTHPEKESSLREELLVSGEADKWKQRRNLSFDQNRQLEEITKERDGLKRVAVCLQRAVTQLVAYCAAAEDELNRTVLAHLLARLLPTEQTFIEDESRPSTPNIDQNSSLVAKTGKRVHFAPDLQSVLVDLDEDGLAGFLREQRDLSVDIKRELDHSLRRLRHEAQDLLELSARLGNNKGRISCAESEVEGESGGEVQITELVHELDARRATACDNCDLHAKDMEEAMAECLQRENLLRTDLEAAMMKIAHLMTTGDGGHSSEFIAEGYGTGQPVKCSRPPLPCARVASPGSPSDAEGGSTPRAQRLALDLHSLQKERDDLEQQLEAANRQLRSTRQFVEEQAAEREAERDEFARRLADLRDENGRLVTRLQNNARILNEVEQLETQTREMNQIIAELENKKASTDEELKATAEKIPLLRDIIANLESQLEQKTNHEAEILAQLEEMRRTIDERDCKMRGLLGELDSLRSEKLEQSDVSCARCSQDDDKYGELMDRIREQAQRLEERLHRRTQKLERIHEVCSTSCSEPTEDVSIRDQRNPVLESKSPEAMSPRVDRLHELVGVWEGFEAHTRAEDAALKRIADLEMQRNQLKDVAQEVRAERDVLQTRMSEQALRISSLSARLDQQRNNAEALAHQAASQLSVQLHDATAEVQRLKEELDSKDKQLTRLKQNLDGHDKNEQSGVYGNSCNIKDKVIILERELASAQARVAQLEVLAKSLENEKQQLQAEVREQRIALDEKEDQLNELMALKLEEDNKEEVIECNKTSARTLSDIVSISEFDEQDQQMRRAELKAHNLNISGTPFLTESRDKQQLNRTLPPNVQRPDMSSLHNEYIDHYDVTSYTPRADSLPTHLTLTQNRDLLKQYKRNANETTVFGTIEKFGDNFKHSTAQKIVDNCSLYPNRDVSSSKNVAVEPKKINFSLEASTDNKIQEDEEFTSLRDLGITLDIRQENFPDILTQLKHEIKKSRQELENCKSQLKNAEEQLCEFPALKEEVEQLKTLLENTMATMDTDKKFYENQLDSFSANKKLLEQRLTELTQEIGEKSKDLHLLKEDILRRENMILELAKEKRNLTNKMAELEVKIDELQSRNSILEKYESESHQLREKMTELHKLEQLVSEKNQQIDSLNQHLDRLDDLQRCLNDKTEELDNLKEAFEEKSNEVFQLQDTIEALNRDIASLNEHNDKLNTCNKDLKLKLTKLEKEQENASLKLQSSECELQRINNMNNELTSKIEELKQLTEKLKDKETEIEILQEDIKSFHDEVASLKEQLKMVSRSPSPRSKNGEERKSIERQPSNDKKQLVKIRKQISLLQHELDFNKKELNDKAFELAKSKLDLTELKNNLSLAAKQGTDKELALHELTTKNDSLQQELDHMREEKEELREKLEVVMARLKEESNISELKAKLREKSERCLELENEMQDLKDLVDRLQSTPRSPGRAGRGRTDVLDEKALVLSGTRSRSRSPTAELERAVRDQLDYSHRLDEDIMEQILSASSDEREEIPRLALNISKSSSSIHSSSSERINRLRADNEKLLMQLGNLEARLKDKDALITELNRIRDNLVQEWQAARLRYEAERDNTGRLQLLLDTHKETSESLQNQDSNMIQILKKRLESSMQSELELQQQVQQLRARAAQLERQLVVCGDGVDSPANRQLHHELESKERLQGEVCVLRARVECERGKQAEAHAQLERCRAQHARELEAAVERCHAIKAQLADAKRLKHEASVELIRAKELLNTQSSTIAELERRVSEVSRKQKNNVTPNISEALTEIESHKSELAREIASLKKCIVESNSPELHALRDQRDQLTEKVLRMEKELEKKGQTLGPDEREQALRYLHGRCLRLESCRKALVWQKRYLQRVVAGYVELERTLCPPSHPTIGTLRASLNRGKKRFKCVATVVVIVVRMGFLVRRRMQVRAVAAHALLRYTHNQNQQTFSPGGILSPWARAERGVEEPTRETRRVSETLAKRVLKHELRSNLPSSPAIGDFIRSSPYNTNSPREEPFLLNSSRGEKAAAYLNKLELVSRCLTQAMESPRDVP